MDGMPCEVIGVRDKTRNGGGKGESEGDDRDHCVARVVDERVWGEKELSLRERKSGKR
jgi:hypothetical protein